MLFHRFYDDQLAQASYLVGCAATGESIVIDPNRAVDQYIAVAEKEGLRITHATETHIHADFVSGTRELAARTGARMLLSDAGPPEWQYAFRDDPGVVLLGDGTTFKVGNVAFTTIHTPGHTPEHLSFLLTDTASATEPMGVFTGDFVFVGDVGRPDLLEKAAHLADESETSARMLYRSLVAFRRRPDHLQIWPGHGAGSACGKGLSAVPQSTLGYERRTNWAFQIEDESEFVAAVLEGQTEPPAYFGRMKVVNRAGPPVIGQRRAPKRIGPDRLAQVLRDDLLLDTRSTADFAAGHIPGSVNVPWSQSFTTYAGSVLPSDRDLYCLLPDESDHTAEVIAQALLLIGYDRVRGYLGREGVDGWVTAGQVLGSMSTLSVEELSGMDREAVAVIDVRGRNEWNDGHVRGAVLIPLPELTGRLDEIPADRPVVLHCQAGSRSAIATSILLAHGWHDVQNLTGGFAAWRAAGLPVTVDE